MFYPIHLTQTDVFVIQSSAAHGSKDILICYNDGDATPK